MKFELISKAGAKLNKVAAKTQLWSKKNAPLIGVTVGVIGFGYTAYEAYKARGRVERVLDDVEARREAGEEVKNTEIVGRVATAVALPIVTGTLSAAAIVGSYHVLTNRVNMLSTALATVTTERDRFRKYIAENHPEVNQLPFEQTGEIVENPDAPEEEQNKLKYGNKTKTLFTDGFWLDSSNEYVIDDPEYNMMFAERATDKITRKIMDTGHVTLAEVYGAFNLSSEDVSYKIAANYGWTDSDMFDITVEGPVVVDDENGGVKKVPYISFVTAPKSIIGSINYDKVFAEYNY